MIIVLTAAQWKGLVEVQARGDAAWLASTTVNRLVSYGYLRRDRTIWEDATGRSRVHTILRITDTGIEALRTKYGSAADRSEAEADGR